MKLCSNSTCSSAARLKRCTALETIYRASIRHASGCEKADKTGGGGRDTEVTVPGIAADFQNACKSDSAFDGSAEPL